MSEAKKQYLDVETGLGNKNDKKIKSMIDAFTKAGKISAEDPFIVEFGYMALREVLYPNAITDADIETLRLLGAEANLYFS